MPESLRSAAGSLFVVGLSGTELTPLERAWLKLVRPAGVILFRRNIADAAQTRALLGDAAMYCAIHCMRCVDVEGGTVDRLRDALAPIPSAQAVAHAGLGYEQGVLIGSAVKAFGFNTTLAPVLDLALPGSAEVMGTRASAPNADGVVKYARSFLHGLANQRIAGCGKHFPGLGGGTTDSHNETPSIERGMKELWQQDLAPFRALHRDMPMVMVNHAAYPHTSGGRRPASVSPYWITNVLRKRIGYRGIVFSDDLEMGGILKYMPIEEAVVTAVRAGMSLMEICHSPELILRAYEALIAEGERSRSFARLLISRSRSTVRLRVKLFSGVQPRALTAKQFDALRSRILSFGEKVAEVLPS